MMSVKIFLESGYILVHLFTFKATFEKDGDVFIEKYAPGASGNVFYLRRLLPTQISRGCLLLYLVCDMCLCVDIHMQCVC